MRRRTCVSDDRSVDEKPGVAGGTAQAGAGPTDAEAFGLPKVIRRVWPFKFSLMDNRWYVNKAEKRNKPDVGEALM